VRSYQDAKMLLWISFGFIAFLAIPTPSEADEVTVPFVGCATLGMAGDTPAPADGAPEVVPLGPSVARQLAFYAPESGGGILAPKNWHCVEYSGTSGSRLVVTPDPVAHTDEGIAGPAVVLRTYTGGTGPGSRGILDYMAKLYPKEVHQWVDNSTKEGEAEAEDSHYDFSPYTNDKLTYLKDHLVLFMTPPNTFGLGTSEDLKPSSLPIYGYVKYDESGDTSLVVVEVRLPAKLIELKTAIIGLP
jgi:hypothetical protein